MKKLAVLTLLLAIPFLSKGQRDSTRIAQIFEEIYEATLDKNISVALDYTHPKLFDFVPRAMMESVMEQALGGDTFEIGFLENELLEVKDLQEIEGVKYKKVLYRTKMYMLMKTDSTSEVDVNALIHVQLNESFGSENVQVRDSDGAFVINTKKPSIAILDPQYEDWKILNIEKNMMPILQKIIPSEILSNINF